MKGFPARATLQAFEFRLGVFSCSGTFSCAKTQTKGSVGIEFRGMIPCPRRARCIGEGAIMRYLERPRHRFGFDGGCGVPVEVARVADGC